MRVGYISGAHARHSFIARNLFGSGLLSAWVIENVAPLRPEAPAGLSPHLRDLFDLHFERRTAAELRFFSEVWRPPAGSVPVHHVEGPKGEGLHLNDRETGEFLKSIDVDLIVSYGSTKIGSELMQMARAPFWNCHGGLSPWYRGVATHFWPNYMLEPQMTGVTLHETTEVLDGGGIIHQTTAPLVPGDGVHDIACRALHGFSTSLPAVITQLLSAGSVPPGIQQKGSGKLWRYSDWRPEHLHYIYDYLQDSVVDRVLAGEFAGRTPKLISLMPGEDGSCT